jgi:serine protease inhibitor
MKNKPFLSVCGLLVLLVCALLGCNVETGSDDTSGIDDTAYKAIKVASVTPKELQELEYSYANPVSRGAKDFAFRLSAALAEQAGTENLVCSPFSVWLPLAALVNAVDVQYKAGLLTALGLPGLGETDIHNGVSGMLYALTRQRQRKYYEELYGEGSYHAPLQIANAIFVDYDVTIKQAFAQAFMDYFRGASIQVDFASPAAVKEVNSWAKKHTNGMISEIIQEFDPETIAAIANAIYFFDRWNWEFDPDETNEDVFHAPEGETRAFYMLREGNELFYYEDETLQALPLSFQTGGDLYILLPKDGDAAGLLASLTDDYFSAIQAGLVLAKGKLLLPRFSIEGDVMSFKSILKTLGVPLFNADSLTGLIEEMPLQVSDALHKAVIKVDEKGTTAAAVTLLPGATSAGPQEPEAVFAMNCNKPFVFVLYDQSQVVFTGMVNKP